MGKVHVATLLAKSWAMYVTVDTPMGYRSPFTGADTRFTTPELSEMVGSGQVAVANADPASVLRVILVGHPMIKGGMRSIMIKEIQDTDK